MKQMLPLRILKLKSTTNPIHLALKQSHLNTWASSIKYAQTPLQSLNLFIQMHKDSIPFDTFSILFTLKSATKLCDTTLIHHLHSHILKLGFKTHVYVATSLLHSYAVLSFDDACKLFDEMPDRNTVTYNTMINGFSRGGFIEKAFEVFETMPVRNVASWNAMIGSYMSNGFWSEGLGLFREMVVSGEVKPDDVAVITVLSGCSGLGSFALLVGKSAHGFIVKNGWEMNVELGTVLVDMYAKCGFFRSARVVFDLMDDRNVMTWTALICGTARCGYSNETSTLFKMMLESGVRPNEMTFTGILNACAKTGSVEEGRMYFKMIEEYGLELKSQHYGCLVNLFSKAGMVEEAYEVIKTMKFEPTVFVWGSFLSACRDHNKFEMAERVVEQVLKTTKPENVGRIYSLLSDLYMLNGKVDEVEKIGKLMLNQNVRNSEALVLSKVDQRGVLQLQIYKTPKNIGNEK